MDDRRRRWSERHETDEPLAAPSPFVVDALAILATPPGRPDPPHVTRALDVACGRGRHALLLASHGYDVTAVDYALPALTRVRRAAAARGWPMHCLAADLTTWRPPVARYALVVVVDFLERALFGSLRTAVAPGGALLMETFLDDGSEPAINPAFLMKSDDFTALAAGWEVLARHRTTTPHHGRPVAHAGILVRRPTTAGPVIAH